jgi:hypothetical protein
MQILCHKIGNYMGDQGVEGTAMIKIVDEEVARVWTRLTWFRIGSSGGLLCTSGYFRFRKRKFSWPLNRLLNSDGRIIICS